MCRVRFGYQAESLFPRLTGVMESRTAVSGKHAIFCGSHHSLTSEKLATDIVAHTEVHVDTLQPTRTPPARLWLY